MWVLCHISAFNHFIAKESWKKHISLCVPKDIQDSNKESTTNSMGPSLSVSKQLCDLAHQESIPVISSFWSLLKLSEL